MRGVYSVEDLIQRESVVTRSISNFSDMDLSNLDLSTLEPEFWEGAIFYNTNFSNTGIRFNPKKLGSKSIKKCNFENVDLSYIDEDDWYSFDIEGANLRNTGVKINILDCQKGWYVKDSIGEALLDESYGEKPTEYWDECGIDLSTIRANPFLKISPYKLFKIIIQKFPKEKLVFLTTNQMAKIVSEYESILDKFDDGTIARLYKSLCPDGKLIDRLNFFQGEIKGKTYETLQLKGISLKVLSLIKFSNCSFEQIEIDNELRELANTSISLLRKDSNNIIKEIKLTDLNFESWKNIGSSRIGIITFRRFLYLELGEKCNCRCQFCRNKSFENCNKRNLSRIIKNLKKMEPYLDTIFIGGGEPSLYIDDIIKIDKAIRNKLIIVTNGTIKKKDIEKIRKEASNVKFYISRHAVSDKDNSGILNPSILTNVLSMDDIKEIAKDSSVSFSPVCVKGGLDNSEKIIEYIATSIECGIYNILISSLHEDSSMGTKGVDYNGLYVSPTIFDDVIPHLLAQGFEEKELVCSTGGYILKRFKKASYTISFKIYISKEQFSTYWKESRKKTFDFTMTSNGDVYQDWCRDTLVDLKQL